jgi:hypothetical protein
MKKKAAKTTASWRKKQQWAKSLSRVKKVLLWLLVILCFFALGWFLGSRL